MSDIIINEKQLSLITEKQQLNESLFTLENILMAVGFVPVIGEVADIALICYYLYKGEKLYAALMLIALIPTVGDIVVKPIIKLFQGSREGMVAIKQGGIKLTEYLAKHPEMANKFSSLGKYVKSPAVEKTVEGISKVSPGLGSKLKSGLSEITGGSTLSSLKAGGKEVIAGGSFKTGLKDYFQGEKLSKYFARHGVLPETGVKRWWLKVGARQDRRNSFRKFISANNLLNYFGVPSITTFERKMSDDAEFRTKVANDPQISDYIAKNYNSDGESKTSSNNNKPSTTQSTTTKNDNPFSNLFGGLLNGQLGKEALAIS